MDREEFRAAIQDTALILSRLRPLMPKTIDDRLVTFFQQMIDEPAALELAHNLITEKRG